MPDQLQAPTFDPSSIRLKRRRLPKHAFLIFEDFFNNNTQYPKKAQREILAAQLKATVGAAAEHYTEVNVLQWFASRRRRSHKPSTPLASSNSTPAFAAKKIDTITKLLEALPNPPLNTITVWASLLNTTVEEVVIMIKAIQDGQMKQGDEPGSAQPKLPTPTSLSPEPVYPTDFKAEPSLSPAMFSYPPLPLPAPVSHPSPAALLHHSMSLSPIHKPASYPVPVASSEASLNSLPSKAELLKLVQDCLQGNYPNEDAEDWEAYSAPMIKFLQENGGIINN